MSDTSSANKPHAQATDNGALERERYQLMQRLENWLETPMLVLAFAWLALLMVELIWVGSTVFESIGTVIWVIFIVNFASEFVLAPHKLAYLKSNWLTALSLLAPALRLFRIFRVLRGFRLAGAVRGLRLLRIVSSLNRGMGAMGASLSRRGFAYVIALTLLITFAGAAEMYAFENQNSDGRGLNSYSTALWWTAMLITTMGSEYWPQTIEGRILCFLLAVYAFAVFGYVTASLATFFVGRDAENDAAEVAGAKAIAELKTEISALRGEIRALASPWDPAC